MDSIIERIEKANIETKKAEKAYARGRLYAKAESKSIMLQHRRFAEKEILFPYQ